MRRWGRLASGTLLGVGFAAVVAPEVAYADNCGSLSDCYNTAQAALAALVGMSVLAGVLLSVGLDFIPGVGTVKGIIEAFTGRDSITGQELERWERVLGIIPLVGGVPSVVAAGSRIADSVGDLARAADDAGDAVDAARVAARAAGAAADATRAGGTAADVGRGIGKADGIADEVDDVFRRFEAGDPPPGQGALLGDLMRHRERNEAMRQLRELLDTNLPSRPGRTPDGVAHNPNPGYQSAHTTSQSALRDLPQYDPGEMITRFLPTGRGHPHTLFDQHWQREFQEIHGRTGRTTTTAEELANVSERAARQSGAFSPAEAESVVGLIHEDLYVQLGLSRNQVLRMPGFK